MPRMTKTVGDRMQEETRYHENTKVRKYETREDYIGQQVVFRAFQLSCFRDGFQEDPSTTDNRQRTTDN